MENLTVSILLLILISSVLSYDDVTKAMLKLEEYGYLRGSKSGTGSLQSNRAIKNFQEYAGINVTGKFDKATVAKLQEPRCGMKDPIFSNREKRYVHQGSKWHKQKLTYKIIDYSRYTTRLTRSDIRRTIRATLDKWMAVTNLDFIETASNDADIRIRFVRRRHGDPYEFDGRGGTLAHAFYPMNNKGFAGDAHFDDDEYFTLRSAKGTNFYWVALHEFGHSIGLEHSNQLGAVMYPWYQGYKGDDPKLTHDDIVGIQYLYGARAKTPDKGKPKPTIATKKPKVKTSKPKKDDKCFNQIKAVLLGRGEKTYVINDDQVYILGRSLRVEYGPYPISTFFPGLTKVDVAMKTENGDVVFFHQDKYWIFDSRRLKSGPHHITKYGLHKDMTNLNAVLSWRGTSKQYFFKGDRYWRFDAVKRRIDPGYPKSIALWNGIPANVNAAFQWRNKALYFFKGHKFYRYDTRRMKVIRGYPKKIFGDFVICPSKRNEVAFQSKLTSNSATSDLSNFKSGSVTKEPTLFTVILSFTVLFGLLKSI